MNETECYLMADPYGGWSVIVIDQWGNRNTIVNGRVTMEDAMRDAAITLGKPVCIKIVPPP